MNDSITFAKKYLEDLLSFFGLNTDIKAQMDEEVIELSVPSTHLNGFLIGQRGETLRALQFMVSTALRNNGFDTNRVNVDVADYKRHRRDRLAASVQEWIDNVKTSQKDMSLQPMNAADRRVVHKVVGDNAGVSSTSEGEGRDRHVIIVPEKTSESEPDSDSDAETDSSDDKE